MKKPRLNKKTLEAMQEMRRTEWEQAAIYWDTMAEGPCKDGEDFAWACRVAQWCREQARKKTHGEPPRTFKQAEAMWNTLIEKNARLTAELTEVYARMQKS